MLPRQIDIVLSVSTSSGEYEADFQTEWSLVEDETPEDAIEWAIDEAHAYNMTVEGVESIRVY